MPGRNRTFPPCTIFHQRKLCRRGCVYDCAAMVNDIAVTERWFRAVCRNISNRRALRREIMARGETR